MLAKENDYIKEVALTVCRLSQEEMIRLQCEAREDYYRTQRDIRYVMEQQSAQLEEKDAQLESLAAKNQSHSAKNSRLLAWAVEHGYQLE